MYWHDVNKKVDNGYLWLLMVSNVIFNIFAKNFVAGQNSAIHKERKRSNTTKADDDEKPALKRNPCEMKKKKLNS